MATIWRGGCIIRARFLDRITDAYADEPGLPSLLVAPYFPDAVAEGAGRWRRVVAGAAQSRAPDARLLVALAYYDGLRARAAARRPGAGAA